MGEPELLVRDIGRLAWTLGLTDSGALYYELQNGNDYYWNRAQELFGN